jgi:hypothetical protein
MPKKISRKKRAVQKTIHSNVQHAEQDLTVVYVAGGLLILLVLAQYLALF